MAKQKRLPPRGERRAEVLKLWRLIPRAERNKRNVSFVSLWQALRARF
jgi:hypothetical protein